MKKSSSSFSAQSASAATATAASTNFSTANSAHSTDPIGECSRKRILLLLLVRHESVEIEFYRRYRAMVGCQRLAPSFSIHCHLWWHPGTHMRLLAPVGHRRRRRWARGGPRVEPRLGFVHRPLPYHTDLALACNADIGSNPTVVDGHRVTNTTIARH